MINRPNVSDPGRIIAHRGASKAAPENTLGAFRRAAEQGVWWVEFDVSLLGDGTPVIHHDATLDRCTNRTGALADLGIADLASIDCGGGEPLPTLEQGLDLIEELGLFANLEMKIHGEPAGQMATMVAPLLQARPWSTERVIVSSFSTAELDRMHALVPGLPLAVLFREPPDDWTAIADRLSAAALHVRFDYLTSGLIAAARRRGMDIRTFTVNDPIAVTPFREYGISGVITDHPPFYLEDADWRTWGEQR